MQYQENQTRYILLFILLVQLSSSVRNEVIGKSFKIIIHVSFHTITNNILFCI